MRSLSSSRPQGAHGRYRGPRRPYLTALLVACLLLDALSIIVACSHDLKSRILLELWVLQLLMLVELMLWQICTLGPFYCLWVFLVLLQLAVAILI